MKRYADIVFVFGYYNAGMREQQSKNIKCVSLIVESQIAASSVMFIDASEKQVQSLNHVVKDHGNAVACKMRSWKV